MVPRALVHRGAPLGSWRVSLPTYNFSQISHFEFEELCRDLLQAELDRALELFTQGPDGGIDIRCLGTPGDGEGTMIAQCKRWDERAYKDLLSHLKRDELPKVKKLAPDRYILMTSVGLTPHRKQEIVKALEPWVHTEDDVLGVDDLTGLLARHPDVERRHLKLWLTSTEVLDALLNSDIATRSEAAIEHAQRQLRLWVENPSFDRARDMLEETNVCVISGAPGIGKTMLADILLYGYTARGFQPVAISADIDEGERAWRAHQKQVFYYDDFLGHVTYGEVHLGKNEDSRLARFLERVRNSEDKKLILTTREYILSEALTRYRGISEADLDRNKNVVSLEDYSRDIRAKILYNHLVFSEIPQDHKATLVHEGKYWDVIKHRNYNPRIIDHAVNILDVKRVSPREFISNFLDVLDNPAEVWEQAYVSLSKMARYVLLAVASLPSQVLLEDVRVAVKSLASEEFDPAEFKSAVSMVEGTFLDLAEARPGRGRRERVVTIRDPSVHDYLWSRLEAREGEGEELLNAAVFFEQCVVLYEGSAHASHVSWGREQRSPQTRTVVDHGAVASRSVELIDSANPRLIRARREESDYLTRDQPSQERRAAFVTRVLAEHRASRTVAEAAAFALEAARVRWAGGLGSASEGMALLREAGAVREVLPRGALHRAEQAFLELIASRLEELDDFSALVDLAEWDPVLFSEQDRPLESWRGDFEEFLQGEEAWLVQVHDDPDLIEEELFELSRIAEAFGSGISEPTAAIEARIEELRNETRGYDDDDDWRDWRSDARGSSEDAEIDALFRSLL